MQMLYVLTTGGRSSDGLDRTHRSGSLFLHTARKFLFGSLPREHHLVTTVRVANCRLPRGTGHLFVTGKDPVMTGKHAQIMCFSRHLTGEIHLQSLTGHLFVTGKDPADDDGKTRTNDGLFPFRDGYISRPVPLGMKNE